MVTSTPRLLGSASMGRNVGARIGLAWLLAGVCIVVPRAVGAQASEAASAPNSDIAGSDIGSSETVDELDGHDRVPPLDTRAGDRIDGDRLARDLAAGHADDRAMPLAFEVGLLSLAAMAGRYDRFLDTRSFGNSSPIFGIEAGLVEWVLPWLGFGGRFDARGKAWGNSHGGVAYASGLGLVGVAVARAQVGRAFDFGVELSAGAAVGGTSLEEATRVGLGPRIGARLRIALRVEVGLRFFFALGYDYSPIADLDQLGSNIDLGGPGATLGVEVRG